MANYKIKPTLNGEGGGGSTVVANPTLVGTEPDLTGLQVGNNKYKVSAGGSSGGDACPYLLLSNEIYEVIKGAHLDLDKLIEILESKIEGFDDINLEEGGNILDILSVIYDPQNLSPALINISTSSEPGTFITITVGSGTEIIQDASSNIKTALLNHKETIESLIFTGEELFDAYTPLVGVATITGDGDLSENIKEHNYTYKEFNSLFVKD